MYRYNFTNDLRITVLETLLQETAVHFITNTIPTALVDKSGNNKMNTLGFYFNLTANSKCAKECANGNIQKVLLNFIKKFQFPNPRMSNLLNEYIADGITLAPMREIVKILYVMNIQDIKDAYLTRQEIVDFIFYNKNIAKSQESDIIDAVWQILEYRKTGNLPANIETNDELRLWKYESRQVREMISILKLAGFVIEGSNGKIRICSEQLTYDNKAELFDITTYSKYWKPINGTNFDEEKKSYVEYMDLSNEPTISIYDFVELGNKDFIFKCLDFMKAHDLFNDDTLGILCSKEKCATLFKHNIFHGILYKVNHSNEEGEQRKDDTNNLRYYADSYTINGLEYFVSSEWKPDKDNARKPLVIWITSLLNKVKFITGLNSKYSCNRIVFGAPGTGKSFSIMQEKDDLLSCGGEYERVTFHPDYSYAQFVGAYKPVSLVDKDGHNYITYQYVPGPFMRIYVKALKNSKTDTPKPNLLLIEEINRANVSAVFGEIFQLLDRDQDNVSEYEIQCSEDIKKYLTHELGGKSEDYVKIKIPDNMFIWSTMNSADQGVFPMDTAFKRRWDFEYIGINDNMEGIEGKKVVLGKGKYQCAVDWNELRMAINDKLSNNKINEDKLLGPYFLSKKVIGERNEAIDEKTFKEAFKSKVIMYLFSDAVKQKCGSFFEGCEDTTRYSSICAEFDRKGVCIFGKDIFQQFSSQTIHSDQED